MSISDDQSVLPTDANSKQRESCVPYFDALWFCYSPGHQLTEYYRYGNVDDCSGQWRKFYNCLKKRTKYADQAEEETKPEPFWEMRTKEEAMEFWVREFGTTKTGLPAPEVPERATYSPVSKAAFDLDGGKLVPLGRLFLKRGAADAAPGTPGGDETVPNPDPGKPARDQWIT
eukprot:jgi/Botrbrau1/15016/Bobra.0018s0114.1